MMNYDLGEIRRWFAQDVQVRAPVLRNTAVTEAFARVPRERFLRPGPWRLLGCRPYVTSDADPRWLYHDLVVTINEAKQLNNGQPSFWAHAFDNLGLRPGERVMQVGAATGYCSAILAEIVGIEGQVTAIECEADLAGRARENLEPLPHVEVVAGDGTTYDAGEMDAVIVCAGATQPAPLWLDRLADGGRLLMPLTSVTKWGFVLRAVRRGDLFDAESIGGVGIFNCVGARDEEAAKRLQAVLSEVHDNQVPIRALYRGEPPSDAAERVWYQGPDFWLERKTTVSLQ